MRLLLVTPPFTQLNTPYPATAYLKGYLNRLGIESRQADLGIELILKIFTRAGLNQLFAQLERDETAVSENVYRMHQLQDAYLQTIEPVIAFLQNKNPTLAHAICSRKYLPEAGRFAQLEDLEWAFGSMGTHDKARHLATLYLEDIGDLIKENIDEHFGFTRYAERLGRTATHFDELEAALQIPETLLSQGLIDILETHIQASQADVLCISIPFPGNLFGALKCGQYVKKYHPHMKVVIGGGYVNTELRSLKDERLFDYIDFVSLDDGEAPLQLLLEHLDGKRPVNQLKRVFSKQNGVVCYWNAALEKDIPQRETGTPDYSDLYLHDYLSVIDVVNPMHRLWSDGRWNKLTLAHGCYWGKCSFCDVSLDYIQRYEPISADILCDRIEQIIAQTGQHGFHFVDEAAPPALMRDLAIEIIRRNITVVWWTNIRFEKSFSPELCRLLKASGCIAVSGGLEVASDRLLELMEKGVTVAQVARVANAFTQSGIMVHAYLMYGFPTQTAQETIDSLEMVRQLFETNALQSGFWHQFAMTAHSPVGMNPEAYKVQKIGPDFGGFADNDLFHDDPEGCEHELFAEGLRISLFNYMHGVGFDIPLQEWFDFKTPRTKVPPKHIEKCLAEPEDSKPKPNGRVIWIGGPVELEFFEEKYGRDKIPMARFVIQTQSQVLRIDTIAEYGEWFYSVLPLLSPKHTEAFNFKQLQAHFEQAEIGLFEDWLASYSCTQLREAGLLFL